MAIYHDVSREVKQEAFLLPIANMIYQWGVRTNVQGSFANASKHQLDRGDVEEFHFESPVAIEVRALEAKRGIQA
jgi:hypothetical protein